MILYTRSIFVLTLLLLFISAFYVQHSTAEETKFGLTTNQRKQAYKDIVAAEDRAWKESESAIPLEPGDQYMEDYKKQKELSKELMAKYKKQVEKKYSLNADQLKEIGNEGLINRWPMD